ncbi:hypothetical protein Dsin_025962 [Dipteronia sinensis]|uniref:Glycosyltransferase n=1 Tax=Dipteronia sinensis TaxID=43782 RepID=A0AAD9ZXB2_9ROSI|nr:hypothetical protein Dsin_025962 [Dipteronia sinensis]
MTEKHRIALIPSPGMGHLIPLVELAKQLVLRHEFSVTFIVPTVSPVPKALKTLLQNLPQGMDYLLLPPVHFDEDVRSGNQIVLTIIRSLSSIRGVLMSLVTKTRLTALIVDLFGIDVFDIAKEFNIPSYIYFLSTAMSLSLLLYLPKLDQMVSCEFRDNQEPIKIPGFRYPFHGKDLPEPMQNRNSDIYKVFLKYPERCRLADGLLINTFVDLEPEAIKSLQGGHDHQPGLPPIYPIGPLVQDGSSGGADGSECIKWLDDQARDSVLYVSFGSGGTLSQAQLIELALGLELSEQKFIWVLKSPDDKSARASFFSAQSNRDPFGFLPTGFLERTKERGLVVPSWAPQIEILSHGSTGGFLTHCGWNSTLESIVNGVPLIAWPLFAEQRTNAVVLTDDLKVALRPKDDENGVVEREEIVKVVKGLMGGEEGDVIRDRMKLLKESAAKALSENGTSTKAISELVVKLKNQW